MNFSKISKPPRYFIRTNAVSKILRKLQYESILELGYGDGYVVSNLTDRNAKFKYGFETSDSARKYAKKRFQEFGIQDLISLPTDSSIDVLMSFETIGYFPEVSDFFELTNSVLKFGGLLLFSATIPNGDNSEESVTGMKVFSNETLQSELKKAGYELILVEFYGGLAVQFIHRLRGIFRKATNLESQKVEESWSDPFESNFIRFGYVFTNIFILPLEYLSGFFSNSYSGLIILARKASK